MAASKVRGFNRSDWDSFAGAERWSDGDPIVREFGEDFMVIAHAAGVDALDSCGNELVLPGVVFPTRESAVLFLDALPQELESDDELVSVRLGFVSR